MFQVPIAPAESPRLIRWNGALSTTESVDVRRVSLAAAAPRVISIAIREQPVPVRSFTFAADESPGATLVDPAVDGGADAESSAGDRAGSLLRLAGSTRVNPPRDVIKLEDRLHYVLQPSLESLLAERSLRFPLQPFSYQLEGVAFLYPRHAAVLADQMGQGKTMQAITAFRL